MPAAPSTPLTARAEPRFLAWAAAALPRAFPGLPALTATTLRAAWTLAAREIAARLALALAREDLVAVDHDALRGRAGPISVPLRRRGAFGLHQPDLDAPRTAPLEHPHALLTALDLGLAPATRARLELELADSVFHLAMARVIAELRVRARLARAPWPAPLDPENLVISGHPWHPMCKTRLGLHLHEVLRFAPEALAAARVHAVDVDPALVHTSGAFAAMSAELFPPAAPGWLRLPVHALQLRRLPRLLAPLWGNAIRPTVLAPLPARALLSLRTVAIADLHLKLAADLQTTSARRQVSPMSSRNGPPLGALIASIAAADPQVRRGLRLQPEPAAAGLAPEALAELAPRAGQLGAIFRRDLRQPARELADELHPSSDEPTVWVCAALGERWPGDPGVLRAGPHLSQSTCPNDHPHLSRAPCPPGHPLATSPASPPSSTAARATRSCARSPPPTPPPRPPSPTTSISSSRPPCACAAPTASPSSSTSRTPSSSTAAAACAASSSATSAASASTAPASPPPATTRPSPPGPSSSPTTSPSCRPSSPTRSCTPTSPPSSPGPPSCSAPTSARCGPTPAPPSTPPSPPGPPRSRASRTPAPPTGPPCSRPRSRPRRCCACASTSASATTPTPASRAPSAQIDPPLACSRPGPQIDPPLARARSPQRDPQPSPLAAD
ncbi:MAG: IucA/IucC family protein [Nannocystis sp.]|nr:IucA/IucC family protein [Nannocystis sp.]MBK9756844.1 IucA/IucC family protein [Nannocystis sp.]